MFVYFIKAFGEKELERIKIGRSKDPETRLRELQTGSPVKLKLLGFVKCKSDAHAKQVEKLAHKMFVKQRKHGEWFRLSYKHVALIKNLIEKVAERRLEDEIESLRLAHIATIEKDWFLRTLACKVDPYL